MSINDSRWSEKFDASGLDGEDWLVPDPKVLRDIEQRIYTQTEEKPVVVFWKKPTAIMIGLLVLGLLLYFLTSVTTAERKYEAKTNLLSSPATTASEEAPSVFKKVESTKPNTMGRPIDLISENSALVELENKTTFSSARQKTELSNFKLQGPNSDITADLPLLRESPDKLTTSLNTKEDSGALLLKSLDKSKTAAPQVQSGKLAVIDLLTNGYNYLQYKSSLSHVMHLVEVSNVDFYRKDGGVFTEIARGKIAFKLNDNFDSAVSGAEFFSRAGETWSARIGYSLPLDKRFNLDIALGYERQDFISGHNTTVEYSVATESNQSNSVALGMATPLGFISGGAVITREANVDQDVTSLLVDLTNAHQIQAIELSALLSYQLVQGNAIGLSLEGGLGVKRLFDIRNELLDVAVNNTAFSSQNLVINSDQEAIIRTLPEFNFGALVYREFGKVQISAFYRYKFGLSPIYRENGSSTSFRASQLGLRLDF